jgi:hypothetical protein
VGFGEGLEEAVGFGDGEAAATTSIVIPTHPAPAEFKTPRP